MTRGDGDFLSRWSSRKLKARDEPEPEAPPSEPSPPVPAPDLPEKTDEEILRNLGLPDPETLGKGDDFSAFLKAAVPTRLRNRALRRLWVSNPVLANLDGLNDYDGDFTDAATVVKGGLKTAYQVGRGFLRDEDETVAAADPAGAPPAEPLPDQAAADAGASDPEPAAGAGEETIPAPEDAARDGSQREGTAKSPAEGAPPSAPADTAQGLADPMPPRSPRMRFRFDRG